MPFSILQPFTIFYYANFHSTIRSLNLYENEYGMERNKTEIMCTPNEHESVGV